MREHPDRRRNNHPAISGPVTEETLDRAATALTHNLNRLLAALPADSGSYTMAADKEMARKAKRRGTGHYCWRCSKPIWSDQSHAHTSGHTRCFHGDDAECG